MTITYTIGDSLYINVTNRCTNSCTFCIRQNGDTVGDSGSLWLEREPTKDEIWEDIKKRDLSKFKEVVFCGYGEPLMRLNEVVYISKKIKEISAIPVRINTNGHSDLVHGEPTAKMLSGLIDSISISLNAKNAENYNKLCKPVFGEDSFFAVTRFALECKKYIPKVILTVVDIIPADEIEDCRRIAQSLGVEFRVRTMID